MRNLINIQVPAKKQQVLFSFNDITNILFNNKKPLFLVEPFKDLNIFISIPTYLCLIDNKEIHIYSLLKKAVQDEKIFENLLKLPAWMLGKIIECYKEGIEKWEKFITENLEEYCKTFESRWKWSLVKTVGVEKILGNDLNVEQSLWIYFCNKQEEDEKTEFIISLRDSLLPWINPEMWDKLEKRKENIRYNSSYEEIHKQILDELDIIK